jgi:predicted metal-dependent HD superfamily phosphohydrolase
MAEIKDPLEVENFLTSRFTKVFGSAPSSFSWFNTIASMYSHPSRHYHTLDHIFYMFNQLDKLPGTVPVYLYLAIWFHDIVYDAKRSDNEDQSSFMLFNMQEENPLSSIDVNDINLACMFIERTKTHTVQETCPHDVKYNLQLFLDLDLSILCSSPEIYDKYRKDVALEYFYVDNYEQARIAFLQDFLERKRGRIFFTEHFSNDAAVKNIKNEIATLNGTTLIDRGLGHFE